MPVSINFSSVTPPPAHEIHQIIEGTLAPSGGAILDLRVGGPPTTSFRIPARRVELHQVTRHADTVGAASLLGLRIADGVSHEDIREGLRLFKAVIAVQNVRTNQQDAQMIRQMLEQFERYVEVRRLEAP
jgi:hypothetical protein